MDNKEFLKKKSSDNFLLKLKNRLVHRLLNKTILLLSITILFLFTFITASEQRIIIVPEVITRYLKDLITILVVYTMATLFVKLTVKTILDHFIDSGHLEERILMTKVYIDLIYALATVVIFWQLGISVQNIALFLGLIATGFAFALRDIILSYIIWFILLTKKPFKIGDYIKVGNEEGLVKHIGLFYVVVDPYPENYDDYFKVPNKTFFEKPIKNYGKGRFCSTTDFYLKEIPSDLGVRIEDVKKKAANIKNADAKFNLDSDKDGLRITISYHTTFDQREDIKDKILRLMVEAFMPEERTQIDCDQNLTR